MSNSSSESIGSSISHGTIWASCGVFSFSTALDVEGCAYTIMGGAAGGAT